MSGADEGEQRAGSSRIQLICSYLIEESEKRARQQRGCLMQQKSAIIKAEINYQTGTSRCLVKQIRL